MDNEITDSKIQVLYDTCNRVFTHTHLPTFLQIQLLRNILDLFEAADVGIDEFILPGSPTTSPADRHRSMISAHAITEITYIHIHECENFSIGVFCFPAGGTIPLHDHPGMTVLSKLLYGSIYAKAYDWVKIASTNPRTFGLAGRVVDGIYTAPCEASVLFPRSGGNIHSFMAVTPCAILDVLSPPYSDELGRPSTYFSEFPIPSLPGYTVLEEREVPGDLLVSGAPYLGPALKTRDAQRAPGFRV